MPHEKTGPAGAWAEMLRAWPVLSLMLVGFVTGLLKWSDAQRDLGVIERRQTEIERRISQLEAADLTVGAVLAETRITLTEVRTELRLLRDDMRRLVAKP